MGLDKAIEHEKEKRKKYYGAKAVDRTCRNHGSCDHCRDNRLYHQSVADKAMNDALRDYENTEGENVDE